MRLFRYGHLRDPDLLARGWRRVVLRDSRYRTLRRARGTVQGVLAIVNGPTLARLAAYEGQSYRLTPIVVQTALGNTTARAWIAAEGTRRDWP